MEEEACFRSTCPHPRNSRAQRAKFCFFFQLNACSRHLKSNLQNIVNMEWSRGEEGTCTSARPFRRPWVTLKVAYQQRLRAIHFAYVILQLYQLRRAELYAGDTGVRWRHAQQTCKFRTAFWVIFLPVWGRIASPVVHRFGRCFKRLLEDWMCFTTHYTLRSCVGRWRH